MVIRDTLKNGWHPNKDKGEQENWHKVKTMSNMVRGRTDSSKDQSKRAQNHVSRPANTLTDPSTFGPPPKHKDIAGGGGDDNFAAASSAPPQTSAYASTSAYPTAESLDSRAPPPIPSQKPTAGRPGPAVPPRAGAGAGAGASSPSINTLSQTSATSRTSTPSSTTRAGDKSPAAAASPEVPAGPFRIDTTGLSTANLPPPPTHRDKRPVDQPAPKVSSGSYSRYNTGINKARSPVVSRPSPTQTPVSPASPAPAPLTRSSTANIARANTGASIGSVSASSNRAGPPPPPTRAKPSLPPRAAVAGGTEGQNDPDIPRDPPPPYSVNPNPVTNATPSVGELQLRFARMRAARGDEDEDGQRQSDQSGRGGVPPPPVPTGTKPR